MKNYHFIKENVPKFGTRATLKERKKWRNKTICDVPKFGTNKYGRRKIMQFAYETLLKLNNVSRCIPS